MLYFQFLGTGHAITSSEELRALRTRLVQCEVTHKQMAVRLSAIAEERDLLDGDADPRAVPLPELLRHVLYHFESTENVQKRRLESGAGLDFLLAESCLPRMHYIYLFLP